jgi:hypothetical protein
MPARSGASARPAIRPVALASAASQPSNASPPAGRPSQPVTDSANRRSDTASVCSVARWYSPPVAPANRRSKYDLP